jgi:hypothetical protein
VLAPNGSAIADVQEEPRKVGEEQVEISDHIMREVMTAYYTGLRAGLGRGEALRQAKLAMLRKAATHGPSRHPYQHPFYWASFIQSGEWASLDGRR